MTWQGRGKVEGCGASEQGERIESWEVPSKKSG